MDRRRPVAVLIGLATAIVLAAFLYLSDVAEPPPSGAPQFNVDRIVVEKAARRLTLYGGQVAVKSYPISLGGNPIGHKQEEGDQRTPEGVYVLDWRNPQSRYHLSMHISYPNDVDKAAASRRGVSPGGDIMVHGVPNGFGAVASRFLAHDWTDGCIAVTNKAIEEIWLNVKDGTPIEIRP